jgi:hypothetical protein
MIDFLNNYAVSILAIVALTVLTALGKVDSSVALPLIAGFAGIHAGASISTPSVTVPAASTHAAGQTSTTAGPNT